MKHGKGGWFDGLPVAPVENKFTRTAEILNQKLNSFATLSIADIRTRYAEHQRQSVSDGVTDSLDTLADEVAYRFALWGV